MMDNTLLKLTDTAFPLTVIEHYKTGSGPLFEAHRHEHHLQIFYFTEGKAKIFYNQTTCDVGPGEILLVNANETHYGKNISGDSRYFVFRIDLKLLASYPIISCGPKYLEPLQNGLILFQNNINSTYLTQSLQRIIDECSHHQEGYELHILGCALDLLGELFRNHKDKASIPQAAEILMSKTQRFAAVLEYIKNNYAHAISLSELSARAHMSESYFCRTFKQSIGRTPVEYINYFRIETAVLLLNQGICNVTEAAMSVGFDDINYFSRVFKKYMKQSPENYLRNDRRFFL